MGIQSTHTTTMIYDNTVAVPTIVFGHNHFPTGRRYDISTFFRPNINTGMHFLYFLNWMNTIAIFRCDLFTAWTRPYIFARRFCRPIAIGSHQTLDFTGQRIGLCFHFLQHSPCGIDIGIDGINHFLLFCTGNRKFIFFLHLCLFFCF